MRIGLFGFGHLGKIHLKCLKSTPFEVVGFYDPNVKHVEAAYSQLQVENSEDLITSVDACIVASSTSSHAELASSILGSGKHCFVEKPITTTVEEARALATLAGQNPELITQVGFVERYNPAFAYVTSHLSEPRFIEVHRLAQFNNRGNDVSVVFDLMIHDLDLLLNIKNCPVKEIRSTGVNVLTDSLDICNARLEFEDGSVANVTASRMSMKSMRKFRIFQNDSYISVDLDKKESQIFSLSGEPQENSMPLNVGGKEKHISIKSSGALDGNAILAEQLDFYDSIVKGVQSKANFSNALRTTELAEKIQNLALNALVK